MDKIEVQDLVFKYPLADRAALKGISLTINPSEFIVICGKSGCGKSTLLRHMKKSLIPYGDKQGKVLLGGINVEELDDRENAQDVGFVQQSPDAQIVTDKVWHELAFGLENLGLPNSVIKRRVAEMASYFGIQGWFRRDVADLSGGQKQLLNLASVMAMQPQVLILDEPASQLDPIAASDFLRTVYKINRDLGVSVIISEHRLEEVFPMADRVLVMENGKTVCFEHPKKAGEILGEICDGRPHPMYYGMPEVMRIYSEKEVKKFSLDIPLTVREGRIFTEEMMKKIPEESIERANQNFTNIGFNLKKDNSTKHDAREKTIDLSASNESGDRFRKSENREREIKSTQSDATVARIKGAWFRYLKEGPDILKGLELELKRGELHCLLGGNGTGKSTTLKILLGILKPLKGRVKLKEGLRFAMVPQDPQALFTEISVEDELLEGMAFMKLSDEDKIERTERMLSLMEIKHLRKSNPYDLSGGEQQRLAIGKVMLTEPDVLLLDEPTKGLDPFFKLTLGSILKRLTASGIAIFMVSHDIEFCAKFGDTASMFFDGEITSTGEAKHFFAGNNFYTTTANKIFKKWNSKIITCEEAKAWIKSLA